MKKILLISLLWALVIARPLMGQDSTKYNFGGHKLMPLRVLTPAEKELMAPYRFQPSKMAKAVDLPPVVDNTAWMPPVVDQGGENSCTGFTLAYALGEFRNKQSGYSSDNQFSQSFIYNLVNIQNMGADLFRAEFLVNQSGCAKLMDFPYITPLPTNTGFWWILPDAQVVRKAIDNTISSPTWVTVGDYLSRSQGDTVWPGYDGINQARAWLAADQPVMLDLSLTNDYGPAMQADGWVYSYALAGNMPLVGGHALCIVGYNDTLQTRDGRGAFLVINSWGASMFNKGYCWITYKMLAMTQYGDHFYTFVPNPADYYPKFKVEFHVNHFVNMAGLFYRGLIVNGQKHESFRLWIYRTDNVTQQNGINLLYQPLPDTNIVDITDFDQYIDTTGADNKFFISGSFWKSLIDTTAPPELVSLRLSDPSKGIDTLITTNIVIKDSIFYAEWSFRTGKITGIAKGFYPLPRNFSLSQNYPNPFNPTTTINFSLPKSGQVTLMVYDLLGREVATLVNGYQSAGAYNTKFDARYLASGVYIYRLQAGEYSSIKKLVLMK